MKLDKKEMKTKIFKFELSNILSNAKYNLGIKDFCWTEEFEVRGKSVLIET